MKPSIYNLTKEALIEWVVSQGEKKFRALQIWEWLYRKRVMTFTEMTNLSNNFIEHLNAHFVINPLRQLVAQKSADGTIKYLFELHDQQLIETVLMRQKYGLSVCVTMQVGCNMGCSFCASGLLSKKRNLSVGEIVAQVMQTQHSLADERVSHVVVMGIGEPFDNYENVLKFLHIINDDKGLAIGARHITVSTSGLAAKIYDFAANDLQVNLAISLHAPDDEIRSRLMRINRLTPLKKLMAAVEFYTKATNRRVTFEYILLNGINDQVHHAQRLANLLKNKKRLAYVNLIPYNPVNEHDQYKRSSKEVVLRFYDILKKNKINCIIRQEFGTDIDAACGQLRAKKRNMEEKDEMSKVSS
ncbi:MAG: 23S rRNA (adenine(2503)-C(2))-methyltransferase RlmN [Streptococcaceae bacterium]|jgi:23S rRNA (adenine2503-C2)-methyltransferase|nr:23S rRNA (adenine(2503)-C(2))-methyltransferase RlmN [Streptococcaceae bacterium]